MFNFLQNSYSGEVLEDLLVYTAQGNDTSREGLIHIKEGIQDKYILPMIQLKDIIQDNVATPNSTKSTGDYSFTERYLEPQKFMIYIEFDPADFEKYWRFAQPEGQLLFRELDPKLQAKMLRLLMDKRDTYIGSSIWSGAKGGSASAKITAPDANCTVIGGATEGGLMKYFDGAIKRLIDNINSTDENEIAGGQAILAGATTLTTGEQVEAALNSMWKKCPAKIRKNKDLVFVTSWEVWDLYNQYLSDKTVKYSDNTKLNEFMFHGHRIIPIVGIPEHTIVLGVFNDSMDSNLWMGIDYASDQDAVKVDRLQSNSSLYFFQARMKMDVNIVRPAEIVVWTAYKKATA